METGKILLFILLISCAVTRGFSQELSQSQKEVWTFVESYSEASHQRDLEKYLSYWHADFSGWHNGDDRPTNKEERTQGLGHYFQNSKSLEYQLEPMSILVVADGKAAVVHYKLQNVLQSTSTGEKSAGLSYWTDFLVKENGKWWLIGDHGGGVSAEPK